MPYMRNKLTGQVVEVDNNGVPVQSGPQMPGNPKYHYEGPQAKATLDKSTVESRVAQATQPDQIRRTKAEADKAVADAAIAQQKADQAKAESTLETMGPTSQVHGEQYLKQFVPPQQWATVRAYARGDLGSRAGGMSSSMLPIIQHAMNYDPTASGTNFPARVAMQTQLTKGDPGSIGGSLRSMEQMLLHGQDVLHASQGLNNYHSGIGALLNYPRVLGENITQDPALKGFNEAVTNYAPESQKAIAGATGGEAERQQRGANFSGTMSPEAIAAGLQSDARMAFQRTGAVNDQYRRVMGRDITDALSPAAKAAYDEIMAGGYDKKTGKPLNPVAGWTPISGGTGGGGASGSNGTGGTGGPFNSPGTSPNALAQPFLTMGGATAAGSGAQAKQVPIPKAMQDEYNAFVGKNLGRLSPDEYATYRAGLDAKYGFGPPDQTKMDTYRHEADVINKTAVAGGKINLGIPGPRQPMGFLDQFRNNLASDPTGAAAAGFADMVGMGGVSALAPGQMAASQQAHPLATAVGQIGGSIAGTEGLGMVAKNALSSFAPNVTAKMLSGGGVGQFARNLAADTAYGAGYGGITNGDPQSGALMSALGSGAGQAGGKALGGMASGVAESPSVAYLRQRGVPLTVGRILGPTASKFEDAATSIPGVGDMIARRHSDSLRAFNAAALEDAGSPIGAVANTIGEQGIQSLANQVGNSYDNATAGVRVPLDPQFHTDIAAARAQGQTLPGDLAVRANAAMNNRVDPAIAGGVLTGEGYQQAVRGLKGYRAEATKPGFEQDYRDMLGSGIDALTGAMERGGGDSVTQGLANANQAYRMTKVVQKASEAAKNGNITGEPYVFSPAQLNTAATANANKFGGARPFSDLSDAGNAVLPPRIPDSGTARRLAIQGALGLGGLGGMAGVGALAGGMDGAKDGAMTDLGVTGLLSVLGTKAGQKALTNILVARPNWARSVGGQISQQSGLLGDAMLPYYLEPGQ